MKFSIDVDDALPPLTLVNKIAGSGLFVCRVGKSFQVAGTHNGKSVAYNIPVKVLEASDNSRFVIGSDVLLEALKKRGKVTFEVTSQELILTAASYRANLVIQEGEAIEVVPKEIREKSKSTLSRETIQWLAESLKVVSLKPQLESDAFLPVAVKITAKGAFIASYDHFHAVFLRTKKVTGDLTTILPSSLVENLFQDFKDHEYDLVVTESNVYAFNKLFSLAIPLPVIDRDNVQPVEAVLALADQVISTKGATVEFASEDLMNVMSNCKSVYAKGAQLQFAFSPKEGKCVVGTKSSNGIVKASFKAKGRTAVKFAVEFSYFEDLFSKTKGPVVFTIVENSMLYFSHSRATFTLSLSDISEKETD